MSFIKLRTYVILLLVVTAQELIAQNIKSNFWVSNGAVRSLAKSGSTIYLGGDFSYVGPATGPGVVLNGISGVYDPSWPKINGDVRVVASDGNGGWYIGGDFTSVGGVTRNRIAHILANTSVDSWNPNADGGVTALAVNGANIYVGGNFSNIGGQARSRLAAIRIATGLASSWNPGANGAIYAIEPLSNILYVGGDFTTLGGQARSFVAAIDTSISAPTTFSAGTNGPVYSIALGASGLYVGGNFSVAGGRTRNNLALLSYIGAVQGYDPSPNDIVRTLQLAGNRLYAGGDFTIIAGSSRSRIALLDALTAVAFNWNPNANGSVYSVSVAGAAVYLGGSFTTIGAVLRNNLACVDTFGTVVAWNPNASATVNALAADGGNVFAGGTFRSINGVQRSGLAAIDESTGAATSWNPSIAGGAVRSIALAGTTLYAGGSFTTVGTQSRSNIAAISTITGNPASWNPNVGGAVLSLAYSAGRIYAGGSFSTVGSLIRNRIAAIDSATGIATAWNPNADNSVMAIRISGGTVYAGGFFSSIGGSPRNRIAALNLTTGNATLWNPNGGSAQGDVVSSLFVSNSFIYAGGNFSAIGGQSRNSLAVIDSITGSATPFDAGLNPSATVSALSLSGPNLYAGGLLNLALNPGDLISLDPLLGTRRSWDPQVKQGANALLISDTTVYAGGQFDFVLNDLRPNFAGLTDNSLVLPAFTVSPSTINYGNVRVGQARLDSIIVSNTGGGILTISTATSDNSQFVVVPSMNISIPSGENRKFYVAFNPNVVGLQSAMIKFTHNAAGSPSNVSVNGTGIAPVLSVSPSSVGFGKVLINTVKKDSVTITNTGNAPLTISNVVSSDAHFTVDPLNAVINPASSTKFYVSFQPTALGNIGGNISFTHDAAGSPTNIPVAGTAVAPRFAVTPQLVSFGDVLVNTSRADSVTVMNNGTAPLVIDTIFSSSSLFKLVPQSATVPESTSMRFRLTFTPVITGSATGRFLFHHNASQSLDTVYVNGNGVAAGFSVSPTNLNFGNVFVGTNKPDSVVVQNIGTATLNISSVATSSGRFAVYPITASIPASGRRTFRITFAPADTGIVGAVLTFTHDAAGSPTTIGLTGRGVSAQFSINPSSIGFGNVRSGTTKPESLTVTNTGLAALTILSVASSNPQFAVTPQNAVLNPLESKTFLVAFSPTFAGPYTGHLTFTFVVISTTAIVPVSGIGVEPVFSVTPTAKEFGSVVINSTVLDSVLVSNSGGAALNITSVSSTNAQFSATPSSASIPAGGTRRFTLSFTPNAQGIQNGKIIFAHDAVSSPDSVSVSGTGIQSTFSVSRSVVSFGNVGVGSSARDSVMVSNTGTFAIVISSATSGNTQCVITPPGTTVPAGGTVKFILTYTPTAAQALNTTVTFVHNAAGSPTSIAIRGMGIAPRFQLSRQSIRFDSLRVGMSRQDTVVVLNSGTDTLDVSNAFISHPSFSIAPTQAKISPSSGRNFIVTFSPDTIQSPNATLRFTHNATGSPSIIPVSGIGVASYVVTSPTLSFGSVAVGNVANLNLQILNGGNAALNVDSIRLRGRNASEFLIVGSSGPFPPVAPAQALTVVVRFAPTVPDTLKTAFLIVNSDALIHPDTVTMKGNATGSPVQVTLAGDTSAGSPLDLSVVSPQGFTASRAALFYRSAGRRAYDSLALSQSGQTFAVRFPDSVVNARGVEYYVALYGNNRRITSPEVSPESNPAVVQIKVARLDASLQLQRRKYKMISIPLALQNTSIAAQLFDNYGSYNKSRWRLFRWSDGRNIEFDSIPARFTPGTAFWLITQAGSSFDANEGRSVFSGNPYSILLQPGWNQIASPFAFTVAWDSISNNSAVRRPVFWDGSQYVPNVSTLMPWEGYFVLNDLPESVTLSVPPRESSSQFPKQISASEQHSENDFVLQVSASTVNSELTDAYNFIGFVEGARTGRDLLDMPEPPMIDDFVQLSFVEDGKMYLADYKPLNPDGDSWEMKIRSSLPNQTVHVTLNKSGKLPAGFNLYVLDEDAFAAVPLTDNAFTVQLSSANASSSFKIIIGTEHFAARASEGISLVPLSFSLQQNYPNPFNPTTTIRYAIGKRSEVTLEIFNTLGQIIKTLARGEQVPGVYVVQWDATTTAGKAAASGVYFYRLRAGEFVSSKKLLLLR